jgi:RNA polymerase sigma-70 factor (ECF subfamily)
MTISSSSARFGPQTHPSDIAAEPSDVRGEILALLPSLRAYARLLVGNPGRADDLVETTLLTAWAESPPVVPTSGLRARLFTILREASHASLSPSPRSRGGMVAPQPKASFRDSLAALPIHQRDALLLVVGEGFSSQDASTICGCSAGTIIRRAERGRRKLAQSAVLDQDLNLS